MPEVVECERPDCAEPPLYRAVLFVPAKGRPDQDRMRFTTGSYACAKHRADLTKRQIFDNRRWQVLAGIMGTSQRGEPDWKETVLEWEPVSE
jgi:hypothetical protein